MGTTVLAVVQGEPSRPAAPGTKDSWLTAAPPLALMLVVLALGLFLPAGLRALFGEAAALVGGGW
jgi:hydrogenase-4 component F